MILVKPPYSNNEMDLASSQTPSDDNIEDNIYNDNYPYIANYSTSCPPILMKNMGTSNYNSKNISNINTYSPCSNIGYVDETFYNNISMVKYDNFDGLPYSTRNIQY